MSKALLLGHAIRCLLLTSSSVGAAYRLTYYTHLQLLHLYYTIEYYTCLTQVVGESPGGQPPTLTLPLYPTPGGVGEAHR